MPVLHENLFRLLTGFSALESPQSLHFPDELPFDQVHDLLLTLIDLSYPPSKDYQRAFWKWALPRLENMIGDQDVEIDGRVYEHILSSLPSASASFRPIQPSEKDNYCPRGMPLRAAPGKYFVTKYWKKEGAPILPEQRVDTSSYHTATIQESRSLIENGSTGLTTWSASYVLAEHLIADPDLVRAKNVLELGSGTGFLAIVAATLQLASETPGHFWMTDGNEEALRQGWGNTQLPCNRSSTHSRLKSAIINWSDSLEPDKSERLKDTLSNTVNPHIVLGADLAFDPSLIPALCETLRLCLTANPERETRAFIALTVRNPETAEYFFSQTRTLGLQVEDVTKLESDASAIFSGKAIETVRILRITMEHLS